MRPIPALPLLLAAILGGCGSLRPAPQPGLPLAETAPGCLAPNSLIGLTYTINDLQGATMVAAPGAPCPMPLDQYVGFLRAVFSVTGSRVIVPPQHGTARIARTRAGYVEVIYRSAPDYTGLDGFTVAVLPAGVRVPVGVTVAR